MASSDIYISQQRALCVHSFIHLFGDKLYLVGWWLSFVQIIFSCRPSHLAFWKYKHIITPYGLYLEVQHTEYVHLVLASSIHHLCMTYNELRLLLPVTIQKVFLLLQLFFFFVWLHCCSLKCFFHYRLFFVGHIIVVFTLPSITGCSSVSDKKCWYHVSANLKSTCFVCRGLSFVRCSVVSIVPSIMSCCLFYSLFLLYCSLY